MGVPKFYRWISERYPKINQIISDNALLPEFDHLYLDMNGIIHGCTHPPELDVSQVLSERDMVLGIMHYLDRIITQIVKPRVSVYMAIDGVAPRAKLNQQRSRRYRSAKDMAEAHQGEDTSHLFDSNCITPGTEFLAKISDLIQFFIRKKIKEDVAWRNLTIIFSGHDVPGEGEHKIMNHIRDCRRQPDYQPNTRHCIYGQDADLIMLGLVTHEPHFTILRETVNFNSFSRGQSENTLKQVKKFTKESNFQLLHLSVLREYLAIEFCLLGNQGNGNGSANGTDGAVVQYDLERCIDDFVFMTFLVGNDFLPHLPALDIGDNAFDLLFGLYKDLRTTWGPDAYLVDRGEIADAARLESFITAIGASETEVLSKKKEDDAAFLKKKRRWDKRDGKVSTGPSDQELAATEAVKMGEYSQMIQALVAKHGINNPDVYVDGWKPPMAAGNAGEEQKEDFKGRYYYEKLNYTPLDKDKHWQLRKSYMEGLVWCLAYYYKGCISWGWYYPYHYGPMLSDLIGVPRMFAEMKFEMGRPLLPFEQLMACLPPASGTLVPALYRRLMTDPDSPILPFYPTEFMVDMNGKKNPWEGVNLLPFINVADLKSTIAEQCPDEKLSPAERMRNKFGTALAFRYDATSTERVECPTESIGLGPIDPSFSSYSAIEEEDLELSARYSFEPKLIKGTKIPFPGFPSLNVLPIVSVELTPIGLNCFGTPSKYGTCLLTLAQMPELPPLPTLATTVLGKSLFVNWPMMHEGKVVAISDETQEVRLVKGQPKVTVHEEVVADRWQSETEAMQQMYYTGDGQPGAGGVNVGQIKIRLKLLPLQGMRTNTSNGSTKKVFGREEADVPLQLALWQAPAPDPRFQERGPLSLADRFPVGSNCVLLKGKYSGCQGEVVGILDKKMVGIKVQAVPVEIPFGLALARTVQESYISSNDAARILKMQPGLLGKIAGRLAFEQGRYDLGLNLKSPDGLCVVGYTRKKVGGPGPKTKNNNANMSSDAWLAGDSLRVIGSKRDDEEGNEERIMWEYTPKAIRLIEAYRSKFPQLFAGISKLPHEKKYDANIIFGPNGESWLPVIRDWLNNLDSAKLPRSPVTTQSMSQEGAAAVQKAADVRTLALQKRGYPKQVFLKVPGSALYREASTGPTDIMITAPLETSNKADAPQLGDRIVNLAADGIPFGLRGTVVSIHEAATTGCVEVVMDQEFMGGSSLQGLCSKFRGKLCPWSRLLKISPEDTKNLVDKLVPKGSGKAAVDKIISSIDPSVQLPAGENNTTPEQTAAAPQARAASAPPKQQPTVGKATTPGKAKNRSRTPTPGGMASPGARQAGWREARGPPENNTGFKWKKGEKRAGKNGLAEWRNYLEASKAKKQQQHATLQLKAVLGVSASAPPQQAAPPAPQPAAPTDAVSSLKAVLGVGGMGGQNGAPPAPQMMAMPPPPVQNEPKTAADKLLAMMSNSGPPPPPNPHFVPHGVPPPMPYHPAAMPPPPPSNFNFTYVEEGAAGAMYPPPPPPPPPPAFAMMMQHQPPPPPHMMPGHFPPLQPNMGQPNMGDFPPLQATMGGGPPPPQNVPMPAPPPTSATNGSGEGQPSKKPAASAASMVPSVVVRR